MHELSKAIKFTKTLPVARMEIGGNENERECTCYVKDNGVGFDMEYHDKMFGVFQRLQGSAEYDGSGSGLAPAQALFISMAGEYGPKERKTKVRVFLWRCPKSITLVHMLKAPELCPSGKASGRSRVKKLSLPEFRSFAERHTGQHGIISAPQIAGGSLPHVSG